MTKKLIVHAQAGAEAAYRPCTKCAKKQQRCFMSTVVRSGVRARVCVYCTALAKGNCNALPNPPPGPETVPEAARLFLLCVEEDAAKHDIGRVMCDMARGFPRA